MPCCRSVPEAVARFLREHSQSVGSTRVRSGVLVVAVEESPRMRLASLPPAAMHES